MTIFQHKFWGYELTYPDNWTHKTDQDTEGFAASPEALKPDYQGSHAGQVLVRGEWNSEQQEIESLWGKHVGKLAIMMGAKNVGAAPWKMAGASGFEVEIVLPKQDKNRLWVGIISRGLTILHFMVVHRKEERDWFEPIATEIISSLNFIQRASGILQDSNGLPLPPGYTPVEPKEVIDDIANIDQWNAYDGNRGTGELQAFYLREAPNYGWEMDEFLPYPSSNTEINFARLSMHQGDQRLTVGILPFGEEQEDHAKLVVRNME